MRAVTGGREVGVRSCGRGGRRQGCRMCPHIGAAADMRTVVKKAVIYHSGEVIDIKDDLTCTSESVLYLITCTKMTCRKQYLGETGNAIYLRYVKHEDSVKDIDTTKEVGLHFQLPGHSTADMEIVPIEQVRGGKAARKARERMLIRKYQLVRYGLNTQS